VSRGPPPKLYIYLLLEIGELIVDMSREPIEKVGGLNKDGGGMRVRVPRGGTGTVGEITTEEGDCPPKGTSPRVSCFEENVMEDVGSFCLAVYMQSQTAPVSCQKWEKTRPSVEPTSNAYNCMSVAEEKAAQRNKGIWE
jgi:hypothetical protein